MKPQQGDGLCFKLIMSFCYRQSYLIGWEEFRKSKWLMGYTVVIAASIIDWMLSVSMECDEVSLTTVSVVVHAVHGA